MALIAIACGAAAGLLVVGCAAIAIYFVVARELGRFLVDGIMAAVTGGR